LGTPFLTNSASAYPDIQINMRSDHEVVRSGDTFTVTAASNVGCNWELTWNNDERAGSAAQFEATFTAPDVTKISKLPLQGVCTYADPSKTARAAASSPHELTITVLPVANGTAAHSNAASLAGTGGPDQMVLLSGVVLLFAGATVAMVARRRAEAAELPSQSV
jgi:hypothetical protein